MQYKMRAAQHAPSLRHGKISSRGDRGRITLKEGTFEQGNEEVRDEDKGNFRAVSS